MHSLLTKGIRNNATLFPSRNLHWMRNVAFNRSISFSPLKKFAPQGITIVTFCLHEGWDHWPKRENFSDKEAKDTDAKNSSSSNKDDKDNSSSSNSNKNFGWTWGNNKSSTGNKKGEPPKKGTGFSREDYLLLGATGASIMFAVALELDWVLGEKLIDWETFVNKYLLEGKVVKLVVINEELVRVYLQSDKPGGQPVKSFSFKIASIKDFNNLIEEIQTSHGVKNADKVPIVYHEEAFIIKSVAKFIPTLLIVIFGIRILFKHINPGKGRGGLFNIGKSNAKLFNKQDKVGVGFKDVAGMPEAKQEIQEFVDFLKNPKKYEELGARIPKGALLVGPPGTGKTLLAKATAGEASVPFLSTSGSDFIEMFVGVGPARVRDLFETARDNSPCIIFIDEIDAIGRARGRGGYFGGNDERENTLNQILVEMDGFTPSSGVVVLAGTNRPDILDKALLRPGRFDRQIAIDKPDVNARIEIFTVHLKPLKLDNMDNIPEYAKIMAKHTPGFSGADIANACNEAALIAARRNGTEVTLKDLENAIDRVIAGLEKKSKVLSQKERRTVAFHEAGHALLGWFLEHADPVLKVSIVPRGSSALGYTQYLPSDQFIIRKEKLDDMMCMALGGRVAEEIIFGSITTGAQDDLDRVSQLAYSQVRLYGMNSKIGPLSFPEEQGSLRPYSEETATLIDDEVRNMVQNAHNRAIQLMTEHKEGLEKLASVLLEKEVIGFDDLVTVFGARPWKTNVSNT